jgi:predicted RNA-binding Zn-ribbon protein involved in translation (DUF1610 family)
MAPRTLTPAIVTSQPETPAAQLCCPRCGRPLIYRRTVFNGVSPRERWDYFHCRTCGSFEYRYRTRRLTFVDQVPVGGR